MTLAPSGFLQPDSGHLRIGVHDMGHCVLFEPDALGMG